ncbi:MAG: ABC transporter substrate-binding protein [Brevinematia bacterium]
MRFIIFLVLVLMSSCMEEQTRPQHFKKANEKSSLAYENENSDKIEIAVFPNVDLAYKELIGEFQRENPDIKVEVKSRGFGDHHLMILEYLNANKKLPDILLVEAGFIDGLSPIFEDLYSEPYNAKELQDSFFQYKWKMVSKNENSIIAIPLDISPACVWYRVDVFNEKNVKIEDIKTIEDLYAVGKTLTYDKDNNGKIDHWLIPNVESIYEMILFSSQYRYFNKDGEADLNNPTAALAIQWAKEFRKAGYDANVKEWTMDWYDGLYKGKFAYNISGAWLGWHLENWIAPEAKGKFRVAGLPALNKKSKPMNFNKGGSFLAIPKKISPERKLLAWKIVKWLTTRKENQIFTYNKADTLPAFMPAWEDKIFEEGISYIGGQNPRPLWKEMALDIKESYVKVENFYARGFLYQALTDVLSDKKDVNEALEDAQKAFLRRLNQLKF